MSGGPFWSFMGLSPAEFNIRDNKSRLSIGGEGGWIVLIYFFPRMVGHVVC